MPAKLTEAIKPVILDLLATEPLTLTDLARKSGYNYYTTRAALLQLVETNQVVQFDKGARNVRYTLGSGNQTNQIIPQLVWKGSVVKATSFNDPAALEAIAAKYAQQVSFNLLRIFKAAERINTGAPSAQTAATLKRIRAQITIAVNELEQLAHFGQQILNEPKFWEADMLELFPYDESWNEFAPILTQLMEQE